MRYRYIIATLLLLFTLTSHAQGLPGYVLTLSGDTLRGMLAEMPQQRLVRLLTPDGQLQEFDPTQIQGYGLRGQALIASAPVRLADGGTARYFVLARLLGPAGLYAFANETGLLLQPPAPAATDTLYELNAYNWHLLLNRYLAGCPDLNLSSNYVLNLPFEERYLTQLLTRYNRCRTPDWQPYLGLLKSAYRQGLSLEADFGKLWNTITLNELSARNNTQRLLLVGTFVRASGLQADVGLGYTHLVYQTDFYPTTTATNQPDILEQRDRGQLHQLTGIMRASQRFGQLGRPGLLLGLELGFNYTVHATLQIDQRLLAGGPIIQTGDYLDNREPSGVPHLAASAGLVLPVAARQEVRLLAFYQRYLPLRINTVGLRAAYTLFRN